MIKTLIISLVLAVTVAAAPLRERGLSLHMLPDRVAKLQDSRGGFVLRDPQTGRSERTLSEAAEVMDYISTLPAQVVENGVWIVYTNPAAYSKKEQRKLEALIATCKENKIPVFCCRAADLPDGWKSEGFKSEDG